MKIDLELCNGCGLCVRDCPVAAVHLQDKKAAIDQTCVECRTCLKVCPREAVIDEVTPLPGSVACDHCPVACTIAPGLTGACGRYALEDGELKRTRPLMPLAEVIDLIGPEPEPILERPTVTAIGAGGTYPDYVPAPYILSHEREGVEVVTVVTEVPLSYSGLKLKIDTDLEVGAEGAEVKFEGRAVGMVETEEYGSKMLAIGGVNRLTGKNGFAAARAVAALANREALKLKVKGGAKLEVRVGQPPVIDGARVEKMRVGCGSASAGLFAPFFKEAADEVIVLDAHITSLFSHHAAGRCLGLTPGGLELCFPRSTPGRYFGTHGKGWGGTGLENPLDIVASVDTGKTAPGSTLLITETTGQNAAMFVLGDEGKFQPTELSPAAQAAVAAIAETCQESRVSAVYVGGAGGSARAGVARYPLRLTRAVHAAQAVITCGGAPVFVLPGGGITFMVDVERVLPGAFTWVPTPATVAPVEYTMRLSDYEAMGGHMNAVKPFEAKEPLPWNRCK
ncbi:MAG: 4Fe-4S binding protein [Desulfarculaceae bacterium]|nr:4Fe-4S binding protein [Desulfarculaceae bacterium]MCF8073432.1 4Fe-4S binding protein [Desulfarculaceae bacterium]MCF8100421.1 4Fe-4S binding protein [Desulfarculaceae bacterium]MCF8115843.1 4Fe-4S binding protein [Desulfarculaceae bacterium]